MLRSTITPRLRRALHRIGIHYWRMVLDTGLHWYQECDQCHKRRICLIGKYGYQPRDEQWIETGKFREFAPPRPTPPAPPRSAVVPPPPIVIVIIADQVGPVTTRRERIE